MKLREIINLFNRRTNRKGQVIDKFICHECNELSIGEPNTFLVGTEEEDYCDNCVNECEGCGDRYCEELAYIHEECVAAEEEEYYEEDEETVTNMQGKKK